MRHIAEAYASQRFGSAGEARVFVEQVMRRQAHVEIEFQRFIKSLLRERLRLNTSNRSVRAFVQNLRAILWNDLQIALNRVLRGPVGRFCRWLLKQFRSCILAATRSPNSG
ncbi:MAG: hypothetical protein QM784_19650 [Polyangiaceae bacterium]